MITQTPATLASDRAELVEALRRALLDGGDTGEARARIAAIDRQMATIAAKGIEAKAKARDDTAEQTSLLATAIVIATHERQSMILVDVQLPEETPMDQTGIADAAAARARALADLSRAEDQALLDAMVATAHAHDAAYLDVLNKISAVAARGKLSLPYVASHQLRQKIQMDAARRPDLSEVSTPGSRFYKRTA